MIEAFILIKVEAGAVSRALDEIRQVRGVKNVNAITGPADLIADIEADDPKDLADVVMERLHKVAGVKETDTRFVVG